ncbi:MAG: hypothetical protein J6M53_09185 [Bacteroidaceae bacterium]|nr:hypothetical protein [Bacteroidaceae bacterium]
MKKFLSLAAYALLAVALPLSLASCGGDDDDDTPDDPTKPEILPGEAVDPAVIAADYLPGIWYQAERQEDGSTRYTYVEYRADGTYRSVSDLTPTDKATEDTEFTSGTWKLTPVTATDGRSGTLLVTVDDAEEDEEAEHTMLYAFYTKDWVRLTFVYTDEEGEQHTDIVDMARATRTPHPFTTGWEDTGDHPTGLESARAMMHGQWETTDETQAALFASLTQTGLPAALLSIADDIDQPLRLDYRAEEDFSLYVVAHVSRDASNFLLSAYAGQWVGLCVGKVGFWPDTYERTAGLLTVAESSFSALVGRTAKYNRLGTTGVYVAPNYNRFNLVDPFGWYLLRRPASDVRYQEIKF